MRGHHADALVAYRCRHQSQTTALTASRDCDTIGVDLGLVLEDLQTAHAIHHYRPVRVTMGIRYAVHKLPVRPVRERAAFSLAPRFKNECGKPLGREVERGCRFGHTTVPGQPQQTGDPDTGRNRRSTEPAADATPAKTCHAHMIHQHRLGRHLRRRSHRRVSRGIGQLRFRCFPECPEVVRRVHLSPSQTVASSVTARR
ncbi:MAG: hypothetical protein BWY06_03185 [Candidatus Latescibacteria bacterium ADurb.Bin168]|nr:MAG: hypothetical protein BWY06_03185 [Candidatus Latescibacteria bacterium ADurb.Bin168]